MHMSRMSLAESELKSLRSEIGGLKEELQRLQKNIVLSRLAANGIRVNIPGRIIRVATADSSETRDAIIGAISDECAALHCWPAGFSVYGEKPFRGWTFLSGGNELK